jgi:hypothetical protein
MNPFDYVNEINYGKKDIMVDDLHEKSYAAFMVNRSLSYFPDTIACANLMNQYHLVDNKLQFHFLLNIVRKRKRFSKWIKPDVENDVETIKEYYGYSNDKARQALTLLTPEQLQHLREKMCKGGKTK